jgi:membrane protease YdiL (CAAX protease family)
MRLLADFGLQGWALVAASAVIFGLAHVYQGIGGVLVTTLMGALLGVVYLATGSLLAAMAVHALMDLRLLLVPAPPDEGAAWDPQPPAGTV